MTFACITRANAFLIRKDVLPLFAANLPLHSFLSMMKRNNRYGYKIGYRFHGSRSYSRYVMNYTYKQALFSPQYYRKYPQRERENFFADTYLRRGI